jgi:hypothetical protein
MRLKKITVVTLLAFMTALMAPAATIAAAAPATAAANALTVPITGTGPLGAFAGTFQLQRFAVDNGVVSAVGILSGTVTSATGVVGSILKTVALPVGVADATCEILHLDLGPLHLNLLGLEIDLSRVVLDITAQAGAGNLLGNLLCGVANLLNDPSGLARILNSILGAL